MAVVLYFVALLVAYLYWQFKKKYSYWKERNITSLPAWPFIGSYYDVLKQEKHMSKIFQDCYNQYYNEKYVGGFIFNEPELIVFDPDTVKALLQKDFNYFVDRGLESRVNENIFDQNLFSLGEDKWKVMRQKLTPTFTSFKMKNMLPLLVQSGEQLRAYLKEQYQDGDDVGVREIMAKFTTNTISECAFGLKADSLKNEESEFRKMGRLLFTPSKFLLFVQMINAFLPSALNIEYIPHKTLLENFFLNIVKQMIADRTSPSGRHDFMDLMLELRSKGSIEMSKNDKMEFVDKKTEDKFEMTDELITAQVIVFFAAGFETSSNTMSNTLRELAMHPDIQEKLQDEIDTILRQHDGKITYDAIQEMKYLDMVIDETLRKHPPLGVLNRMCNAKYNLPNTDVYLDKGVRIAIPVYALHHDSRYYPEPENFDPERFTPEAKKKRHPFVYLPFGEGPRNCIGARFGKLQTSVGLVSILSNYSVQKGISFNEKVEIVPSAFVMQPSQEFNLKLVSRT